MHERHKSAFQQTTGHATEWIHYMLTGTLMQQQSQHIFHLLESCIVTTLCKANLGCSRHTSKHGGSHSNDIRFQLTHGGPDISVQGVGMAEGAVRIQQQVQVLLASHVQGA